jgi:hypothetical protein
VSDSILIKFQLLERGNFRQQMLTWLNAFSWLFYGMDQLCKMLTHHVNSPLPLDFCGKVINDLHNIVFAEALIFLYLLIFLFNFLALRNPGPRKGTVGC